MKILLLQNLYTGSHKIREVEDDFPVEVGQAISFNGDIADKDYKIYKVKKISERVRGAL